MENLGGLVVFVYMIATSRRGNNQKLKDYQGELEKMWFLILIRKSFSQEEMKMTEGYSCILTILRMWSSSSQTVL